MCYSNPCLLGYFCLSVSSLKKPGLSSLRAHATPIFISGTTLFQIRSPSEALEIRNSTYHFVGHSWPRRVSTKECSCLCFLFWVAWRNARLPQWLRGKESACNAGDPGLIPGSGGSAGGGYGNPHQCSCLENPMYRGVWWAIINGAAKSQTRLKWLGTAQRRAAQWEPSLVASWTQVIFQTTYGGQMSRLCHSELRTTKLALVALVYK